MFKRAESNERLFEQVCVGERERVINASANRKKIT